MSIPGHYNELVLVGDVREVYTDERGAILGVIRLVDAGEPCEVPVRCPAAPSCVSVGDRLWATSRAYGGVFASGGPPGARCAPPRQVWPPARVRWRIGRARPRGPRAAP
jgi:hypothetical protein